MPTICRGPKPATANYSFHSHPMTDSSNIHPLTRRVIFFLLNDAAENYTLSKDRGQQNLSKHILGDIISLGCYKDTPSRLRETWCWMCHVCVCVCVCVCVFIAQLCPTVCNPMDYSPPGPSIRGILQARILVWVAIPFRGSSRLRD